MIMMVSLELWIYYYPYKKNFGWSYTDTRKVIINLWGMVHFDLQRIIFQWSFRFSHCTKNLITPLSMDTDIPSKTSRLVSSVPWKTSEIRREIRRKNKQLLQRQKRQVVAKSEYDQEKLLDSRPRGRGFEPHRRHCVVVLEQDTFILA